MALETSLANIIIKNNTIDKNVVSGGTYAYTSAGWVSGSSIIEGNTFLSPSASADMLNIDNCSCVITHNKFARGGTSINSYVRIFGSNDQNITDNIFDGYTTNGSSENLVANLNNTSVYERNKNQTKYIAVNLMTGASQLMNSGAPNRYGYISSGNEFSYSSSTGSVPGGAMWNVQAIGGALGSTTRYSTHRADLSSYLPENIKLIDAKMGLFAVTAGTVTLNSGTSLSIEFDTQDMVTASYNVGTNTILDQKQLINGGGPSLSSVSASFDITTNIVATKANTQYLTLDFIANPLMVRNNAISFKAILTVVITSITQNGILQFYMSPLVLRCRW